MRESPSQAAGEAVRLSVIIPAYNARDTIEACLASLAPQVEAASAEIILVDSGTDGTVDFVRERFPFVRAQHFGERMYCGSARNWGVAHARGEIVAFIDADCTAAPDWMAQVLRAHDRHDILVGGAVANGANERSLVGWAAYFLEFSPWMPHRPAGPVSEVVGANMSCRRALFESMGPFIEGTYGSDTDFQWRLAAAGHAPRFEPTILASHRSLTDAARFLRHEHAHGRDFGRVRAHAWNWTGWRAAVYLGAGILIPVKLLVQIVARNRGNPAYLRRLLPALPLVVLGLYAWVWGECRGYISHACGRGRGEAT